MQTYYQDDNQRLFDKNVNWLGWAIKKVFLGFAYFPLFVAGYYLSDKLLSPLDHTLNHLIIAFVFSYFVYLVIFFLKGLLIALKQKNNNWWLPIFIFCVAFTCLLSPWLVVDPLTKAFTRWHFSTWLVWVITIAFGYFIYTRYMFLTANAPAMARFAFLLGFKLIKH